MAAPPFVPLLFSSRNKYFLQEQVQLALSLCSAYLVFLTLNIMEKIILSPIEPLLLSLPILYLLNLLVFVCLICCTVLCILENVDLVVMSDKLRRADEAFTSFTNSGFIGSDSCFYLCTRGGTIFNSIHLRY